MVQKYSKPYNPERIKKRDRYTCVYCTSKEELTVDHVIPKSQARLYGLSRREINVDSNLVTACEQCNKAKGTRTIEDFLDEEPRRKRMFLHLARYINHQIKDRIK
jgi:5-methylcytosine-specific restriction endonuclease McrA